MLKSLALSTVALSLALFAGVPAQAAGADGTATLGVNAPTRTKIANAGISVYAQDPASTTLLSTGKENFALPITVVSSTKTLFKTSGSMVLVNGPAQRDLTLAKFFIDSSRGVISATVTSTSNPQAANGQRVDVFVYKKGIPTGSGLANGKLYLNPKGGVDTLLDSVLGTTLFTANMRVGTVGYAVTG